MNRHGADPPNLRVRAVRDLGAALSTKRLAEALVSAGGAFVAILVLAWVGKVGAVPLLIVPFGASCVLVFALPQSRLAQPRNVIGGHLIASVAGLAAQALAGADPIVVLLSSASAGFIAMPIFVGAATIVVLACAYHRFVSGATYPCRA